MWALNKRKASFKALNRNYLNALSLLPVTCLLLFVLNKRLKRNNGGWYNEDKPV